MMSTNQHSPVYEGESFDDARETAEIQENLNVTVPQSTSTRSLTDSPPIGSIQSPETTERPPLPSVSPAEKKHETTDTEDKDDEGEGEQPKNTSKKKKREAKKEAKKQANKEGSKEGDGNETNDEVIYDTDEVKPTTDEPNESDKSEQGPEVTQTEETATEEHNEKETKSPLLTSHRLSTGSSLAEVNLVNSNQEDPADTTPRPEKMEAPPLPPKDEAPASSGLMGLSGSLPSMPWGAPPVNKNPPPAPTPTPPPARKPSGPFAWFSRSSTSTAKDTKSPSLTASRRNTATSVSTLASNPEHRDGDDISSIGSKKPRRNSLKDQFKMLRLREESLAPEADQTSARSGQASISQSGASPPIIPEEGEEPILVAPPTPSSEATHPGTRSGSVTDTAPVDWEMWQQLVNNGPQALASSEELNAAIKRGIPQTIRGVIWQILADCHTAELEDTYRELVARGTTHDKDGRPANGAETTSSRSSVRSHHSGSVSRSRSQTPSPSVEGEDKAKEQSISEADRAKKAKTDAVALTKLEKAIRRDLGARTSYAKYFVSQGSQEGLFGLCKAYALYDEGVGYAQGMNFIAMPLLFNMDEVDAFAMLVKLMNKYSLRDMFIQDMPGLHRSLYQYERLLEDLEPALYCHLRRRGVPPQLYATQWFLTLFAYRFPLQLVLRIYDLIFEEGLETTILKFGVAIMRRNSEALLEMKDMSALTTFLKERLFDAYIDKQPSTSSILESGFFGSSGASDKEIYRSDILVQDACAVPLTSEMLATYTAEWEEKTRTEKEREHELEHLRHTVGIQGARVRLLEERAEASDKEHVQLASELVHVKVENEELRDINDAMKLQVDELKNVVDKQPAEVEEKLRLEMERIMKRNIEVQNENRAMEDSMFEMEKELVATKMKWAEMSENHETLRQKWSDLRRALD
ncbi:unnamed protein product [Penicillium salamii]|uniref:GTPase-activating protein GYP5 n=1 Tax=Penicillium salamii TaxID=1612424 RepID=A0A9W4JIS1_9EURO|nr:unnamed protein product [Penicillium salamii]CAG8287638.1 unnamed protein product [Penicillium salamii]CAG8357365.1 unnamed protein product [Penicillium salamii]CAG8402526.1 unnamed protein product [Penicillium salamii]